MSQYDAVLRRLMGPLKSSGKPRTRGGQTAPVSSVPIGLDIRHNARKLVAEISLKTKKNQKKFPEVVVF
jgi:hypothetical protein